MNHLRFSLIALFAFIAAIAAGCASLTNPSAPWCWIVTGAALGCLFFGLLAAVYGDGAARAYWVGFSLVGWAFTGLLWIEGNAHSLSWPLNISDLLEPLARTAFEPDIPPSAPYHRWQRIAKAWLILTVAFLSGSVARQLFLRRERHATKNAFASVHQTEKEETSAVAGGRVES